MPGSGNPYNGLILAGNGVPTDQQGRVPGSTSSFFKQFPNRRSARASTIRPTRLGPVSALLIRRTAKRPFVADTESSITARKETSSSLRSTFHPSCRPPSTTTPTWRTSRAARRQQERSDASAPSTRICRTPPRSNTASVSNGNSARVFWPSLSYVGNLSRHLVASAEYQLPGSRSCGGESICIAKRVPPYLGYSAINQFQSDSTSNYNALQAYASKRLGAITATASYTWSKSLGDSSGEGDNLENWQNRHFNYGPTSFDRRHIFTATFVWQLPMLRQYNGIVRHTVGGWQLSGVVRAQTGQYYTVTGSTATGTRRANYLGGSHHSGQSSHHLSGSIRLHSPPLQHRNSAPREQELSKDPVCRPTICLWQNTSLSPSAST